jgi:hypothetical protein
MKYLEQTDMTQLNQRCMMQPASPVCKFCCFTSLTLENGIRNIGSLTQQSVKMVISRGDSHIRLRHHAICKNPLGQNATKRGTKMKIWVFIVLKLISESSQKVIFSR